MLLKEKRGHLRKAKEVGEQKETQHILKWRSPWR